MCWESYNKPVRHIAEEPIRCYKIMRKVKRMRYLFWKSTEIVQANSKIYGYVYIAGKLNPPIKLSIYHPYGESRSIIEEGYHSYCTFDKAKMENPHGFGEIVACEIPRGAYYYKNSQDEMVSSQIVLLPNYNYGTNNHD